jgi:hypothetical protein
MRDFLLGKKVAAIWLLLTSLAGFVLGPGFLWEWRRTGIESARLDLDTIRASLELREKMNQTLQELGIPEKDQRLRQAKIDYFNALEKNLARLEGRAPNLYVLRPPPTPVLKVD